MTDMDMEDMVVGTKDMVDTKDTNMEAMSTSGEIEGWVLLTTTGYKC